MIHAALTILAVASALTGTLLGVNAALADGYQTRVSLAALASVAFGSAFAMLAVIV